MPCTHAVGCQQSWAGAADGQWLARDADVTLVVLHAGTPYASEAFEIKAVIGQTALAALKEVGLHPGKCFASWLHQTCPCRC